MSDAHTSADDVRVGEAMFDALNGVVAFTPGLCAYSELCFVQTVQPTPLRFAVQGQVLEWDCTPPYLLLRAENSLEKSVQQYYCAVARFAPKHWPYLREPVVVEREEQIARAVSEFYQKYKNDVLVQMSRLVAKHKH